MKTITLSNRFRLTLPREVRERLRLRPGARLTVLDKGRVIYLVPERPMRAYRGLASGVSGRAFRDKQDRV